MRYISIKLGFHFFGCIISLIIRYSFVSQPNWFRFTPWSPFLAILRSSVLILSRTCVIRSDMSAKVSSSTIPTALRFACRNVGVLGQSSGKPMSWNTRAFTTLSSCPHLSSSSSIASNTFMQPRLFSTHVPASFTATATTLLASTATTGSLSTRSFSSCSSTSSNAQSATSGAQGAPNPAAAVAARKAARPSAAENLAATPKDTIATTKVSVGKCLL